MHIPLRSFMVQYKPTNNFNIRGVIPKKGSRRAPVRFESETRNLTRSLCAAVPPVSTSPAVFRCAAYSWCSSHPISTFHFLQGTPPMNFHLQLRELYGQCISVQQMSQFSLVLVARKSTMKSKVENRQFRRRLSGRSNAKCFKTRDSSFLSHRVRNLDRQLEIYPRR